MRTYNQYILLYLLHNVHLFWAQVSVYRWDTFQAILTDNACCKWVGNDARRCLKQKQFSVKFNKTAFDPNVAAHGLLPQRQPLSVDRSRRTPACWESLLQHAALSLPLCASSPAGCGCSPPGYACQPAVGHLLLLHQLNSPVLIINCNLCWKVQLTVFFSVAQFYSSAHCACLYLLDCFTVLKLK